MQRSLEIDDNDNMGIPSKAPHLISLSLIQNLVIIQIRSSALLIEHPDLS